MSDTYFSKIDPKEKLSRLIQLGQSKGNVTLWVKGETERYKISVLDFDKESGEIVLNSKLETLPLKTTLLCSFELRGMKFFFQVKPSKSDLGHYTLETTEDLYKAEKRKSYRLLTYPIYNIYAEFDLGESYEGGKVIDLKSRTNQTALFKNFLKLVENRDDERQHQNIKYRIQDLSASGMSLHIGELESQFFTKDYVYKDIKIHFPDEVAIIPEVKVVYIVDYVGGDKNLLKFKVGLNFMNLPNALDDLLGGKINQLLREVDFNKDFEKFTK
jgi:hypothetical protein